MAEKVAKAGVKREDGFLYFIDKQGDISKVKMARGGKKGGKPTKVEKVGVKKEDGYLYFVDKAGNRLQERKWFVAEKQKAKRKNNYFLLERDFLLCGKV